MPHKDPEVRLAYYRAYHQRRRAHRLANFRAYRQKHAAKMRQRDSAYQKAHPDISQAAQAKRRAQKLLQLPQPLTTTQWKAIKAHYNYRCVYCGKKPTRLTMDHITPLSKGGLHVYTNIVPACKPCNMRKNAGPVLRAVQPLLIAPS